MRNLQGKKILILGGTAPCVHVTKFAKEMGVFVYVTDLETNFGPAKKMADEAVMISTSNHHDLVEFIKNNNIDGVLTGPGEFNIMNAISVSSLAGCNFYCNQEQWDICQDKRNFKDLCKRYNLPGVPEYNLEKALTDKDFPVIVKPVDGCSSRGISICWNSIEYKKAKEMASSASKSGNILVEKYINNGGKTIDAKYVAINGNYYLEAIGDRYVLNGGLITAISFYPSKYIDQFMKQVHPYVKSTFNAIGLNDGAFFFQAIPDNDDHIYIYEMGLRVSGGMIYNMTEATSGNNTLKMLIHHSITGKMCETNDIASVDATFKGKQASTMSFPLRVGKISSYNGFDGLNLMKGVIDYTQYYSINDMIMDKHINTLDQLFARVMVVADDKNELFNILKNIRESVSVKDEDENEMIIWDTFDMVYDEYCAESI